MTVDFDACVHQSVVIELDVPSYMQSRRARQWSKNQWLNLSALTSEQRKTHGADGIRSIALDTTPTTRSME